MLEMARSNVSLDKQEQVTTKAFCAHAFNLGEGVARAPGVTTKQCIRNRIDKLEIVVPLPVDS